MGVELPTEEEYKLYETLQENLRRSTACTSSNDDATLSSTVSEPAKACTMGSLASLTVSFQRGDDYWSAVLSRDAQAVGKFWYGVTSTKICERYADVMRHHVTACV